MQDSYLLVVSLAAMTYLTLSILWLRTFGWKRGLVVSGCRILWLIPLLSIFFPQQVIEELPRSTIRTVVPVLVDDSESMDLQSSKVSELLDYLKNLCVSINCQLSVSNLSELSSAVDDGFSPISSSISSWLTAVDPKQPWLVVSDLQDSNPYSKWQFTQDLSQGAWVYPKSEGGVNFRIAEALVPRIRFEGNPTVVDLLIRREGPWVEEETVQVQALVEGKVVASSNIAFAKSDDELLLSLILPPMSRGQHLLEFYILPSKKEKQVWDNRLYSNIEVAADTLGVLHILGQPSWDGRFLRRYLKSEPKYDLISFFILRDLWDQQGADERDLSLIPFPVSRLFNEELENFRVLVLQDFSMQQFLMPSYQRNLVQFVKDGGGLLFIGGARSLRSLDLRTSPLREILPFSLGDLGQNSPSRRPRFAGLGALSEDQDRSGPWFDRNKKFSIEVANPPYKQRLLASVYEEWLALGPMLSQVKATAGLHHTENILFKKDATPLLNAQLENGQSQPLAVASYPGKGRAIWIFTDELWRVAMNGDAKVPRSAYQKLLHSAMTWLMRDDLRKPLKLDEFRIMPKEKGKYAWQILLLGPALRYGANSEWHLTLCGVEVPSDNYSIEYTSDSSAVVRGRSLGKGSQNFCDAQLVAMHPSFGQLEVHARTLMPLRLADRRLGQGGGAPSLAKRLGGADLLLGNPAKVGNWLAQKVVGNGISLAARSKRYEEHYWLWESSWIWLFLLFFPCEVAVRRWRVLR